MKKTLVIIALLLFVSNIFAEKTLVKLSGKAEISILTCDPGKELYSSFGHTAIRIIDPVLGFDKVYNYGTFDFATPNFYMKFVRGQLNYRLSVGVFSHFEEEYIKDKRSIYEQVLNIDSTLKQKVFVMLEENNLAENRYYKYDFFFDNCSSRVRDILDSALNNKIEFIDLDKDDKTFRDLIHPYIEENVWACFGIYILLGTPADRVAESYDYMFLPDHLMHEFNHATYHGEPVIKEFKIVYEHEEIKQQIPFYSKPVFVMWVLFGFLFIVSIIGIVRKKWFRIIDVLLFFMIGILGLLVLGLWTATDHTTTINNLNILWAIPLHFPMAFILIGK